MDEQIEFTITPNEVINKVGEHINNLNFAEHEKNPDRIVRICKELKRACDEIGTGIIDTPTDTRVYVGTHWEAIDRKTLMILIASLSVKMGINPTTAERAQFIEDIGKQFSYSYYKEIPKRNKDHIVINLANGELHIREGQREIRPHDKESYLTYTLHYDYNPEANCPMFRKFLDEVLPDKAVQAVIQEYVGYLFIFGLKLEKLLLLFGSGANGKSVFLEIITEMLGKENVTNFSLENLTKAEGRYVIQIANKLANICTDISRIIDDTGKLKQLASGEAIEGRPLYKDPVTIDVYAKLVFSLNELPITKDFSKGFFRRFLIIPFDTEIPKHKQDKQLAKKIIISELPGILNWALVGLERLLENEAFSDAEAIDKQMDDFRRDADNIAGFVDENNYRSSVFEKILLKELYAKYIMYCTESGYHATSKKVFQQRLEKLGITTKKSTAGMMYTFIEIAPIENVNDNDEVLPF